MGLSMGLNLFLLLAMVATNLLSLYHLSSLSSPSLSSPSSSLLSQQLSHLATIRSTIAHLTNLRSSSSALSSSSSSSSDLAVFAGLGPVGSACHDNPELLRRYMAYTPYKPCPADADGLADALSIRGCHPLPRRRCFSPSFSPRFPLSADPFPNWKANSSFSPELGFDMAVESRRFLPVTRSGLDSANSLEAKKFIPPRSNLDLTIPEFLAMARKLESLIRVGIDLGGGSGTFAARMKVETGAVIVTTTMDLGAPFSSAVAARGLIPLHVPLQQRIPIHDGALDLVRCGRAINRWIPIPTLEFLIFDADRVLRPGGFLWIDHFFCRLADFEQDFAQVFKKLGYKILKWSTGNKTDSSGLKYGEVYLTALMQKPSRK